MTANNELVERVAEAIFNAHPTNIMWRDLKPNNRDVYMKRARAAIAESRSWDVERGPSKTEVDCARKALFYFASIEECLGAAAAVRAKEVGE